MSKNAMLGIDFMSIADAALQTGGAGLNIAKGESDRSKAANDAAAKLKTAVDADKAFVDAYATQKSLPAGS